MNDQQEPAPGCSMPVPPWQGVGRNAKWASLFLALALAVTVFATMRRLLEDASEYAVCLPGVAAAGTLLLTSMLAERSLLRGRVQGCKHTPIK